MNDPPLTDDEVRDAFYSLKTNKSPSYDDISFNAINVFDFIVEQLRYIFSNSLAQRIFPEEMEIARITPIYKGGDKENVVNYRPISVLPCFSKILERIMHNRLYLYLTENNVLYNKQFGFQKGHSTDYAIVQLADQMHEMFNKNIYTLGAFIGLPKAFDTVNHKILLKKLSHYGIKNKSLDWFTCYLSNRKQFIGYNVNSNSTVHDIVCGVSQGSILGLLLFLICISDLPHASKLLDSIMFTDDTNLFYSRKDIYSLFNTVNNELSFISHWFNSNKLSLNADKIKFTLIHKVRERDDIPLVLPTLKINNTLTN